MPHELSRIQGVHSAHRASAAPDVVERTVRLLDDAAVARARHSIEETDDRTLDEQATLSEMPAPPFGEARRGRLMARMMTNSGLTDVRTDGAGNVIAPLPGSGASQGRAEAAPPIVVSAHLDTVFPAETVTSVTRDGALLRGPGISDDARGLAAILALSRSAVDAELAFRSRVYLVATVGEEGEGDLRGVRHLFSRRGLLADGCGAFISLDGAGLRRIVNVGLGSLRYRATLRGRGGHSWGDFGIPNPIHGLASALEGMTRLPLSDAPATTLSVGRWGGGTSINAIPTEAWAEFEVRSEAEVELSRMDLEVRSVLDRTVSEASRSGRYEPLELELEALGRRPAGCTAPDHPLVQAAMAATEALGEEAEMGTASTDANLPMSLGIPAVTLGAGGEAGQAHTRDEWYRNVRGPDGIFRALLMLLLIDGH